MADEQPNNQNPQQPAKPPANQSGGDKSRQKTLAEYNAEKLKKQKQFKVTIPKPVKIILSIPFWLIAAVGIIYIPYMLFTIATSPAAPEHVEESSSSRR